MPTAIALPTIATLPEGASARTRILTAGVEVLHSEGLSALTQQAVAARAGVRQSHITYYFPTRLDLLQATAQFGCEAMMNPISDGAKRGELTFEQFRNLLLPDVTDRGWWRLMIALVNACDESEGIRNWIVEFDAQLCARLREGFQAFNIELSEIDAQWLHAMYIGALTLDMQSQTTASQARARELVARGFDVVVSKARGGTESPQKPRKAASQSKAHLPPRPSSGKAVVTASGTRTLQTKTKSRS